MTSRGPLARPQRWAADPAPSPPSRSRTTGMSAVHSAHPRARVASSKGSPRRNSSRLSSAKKFQAITRSQARSPTPSAAEVDHSSEAAVDYEPFDATTSP